MLNSSEAGVGTTATKAPESKADVILISGADGIELAP